MIDNSTIVDGRSMVGVYGFHILDVICPLFDYFQTLRDPHGKTMKDYLDEFLNDESNAV